MAVMVPKEDRPEDPQEEAGSPSMRVKSRTKYAEEEEREWVPPPEGTLSLLPALPMARAFPQSFTQTMAFAKPQRWPMWFEQEQWEASSDSEPEEQSSSSKKKKKKDKDGSRPSTSEKRKRPKKLPPDYLSPFALEVRSMDADVLVTGMKLDRLMKKPEKPRWEEPEEVKEEGRRRRSFSKDPELVSSRPQTAEPEPPKESPKPPPKAPVPLKERPPWRSVAKGDEPWQRQEQGRKSGRKGASDARRGPKDMLRSESVPALSSGTSIQDALTPLTPLTRGHAELWRGSSKFLAVRELFDSYAADPISASALSRSAPGAADGDDAAPADFLAHYVERQAEIERLLHQKAVPLMERGRVR